MNEFKAGKKNNFIASGRCSFWHQFECQCDDGTSIPELKRVDLTKKSCIQAYFCVIVISKHFDMPLKAHVHRGH